MIRFYNGLVLTMANGSQPEPLELWTDADKIVYLGAEKPEGERPVFSREINLNGNLLMPSFKNAHTHSAMTFLRSFAEDVPLQEWLFEKVFPYEAKLSPEDVYVFDQLAILEYLRAGITASFDMYLVPASNVQACVECGVRTVLCGAVSDGPENIERLVQQYQTYRNYHPLVSYQLGFHAEYTATDALLREIAKLAQAEKQPVFTHISETEREHLACRERHGCSPAQYFEELGLWEYGGGGFHGVWLDAADRAIFKKHGLWVVTCPASNAKLASGIAPLTDCYREGVSLAVGTDGAASNNALDLFREMYLGTVLQKLRYQDAAALPAFAMLEAATVGSARAMGLTDCDFLAVCKQADMIVIDLQQPNLRPLHHIAESLVLSGGQQNVQLTMCAGRVLYENGVYSIGVSPEECYREAERRAKALTC